MQFAREVEGPGGDKNHWRDFSRDEPKYMEFVRLLPPGRLRNGGKVGLALNFYAEKRKRHCRFNQ